MTARAMWYPPGQVCLPPELPVYLKCVHDLKPIVGVPNDAEIIGIHSVIQAANKVSGVPGMHNPNLFMKLADHLFNAQMAKYRSKYSLITFPSNATYTPPALPAHITVKLEPVAGAPSDEEVVKVQDAVRVYQHFTTVPSMFDPYVHMELSQHLFDIQMARHMRLAGDVQPNLESEQNAQFDYPVQPRELAPNVTEEMCDSTSSPRADRRAEGVTKPSQLVPGIDICELIERSNRLIDRSNQLLERTQPADQVTQTTERFNQMLEQFTALVEKVHTPAVGSDQPIDCFVQVFERFARVISELIQPVQHSNQHAERLNQLVQGFYEPIERSNELSEQANQLADQLNRSAVRYNVLAEQAVAAGRTENMTGRMNRIRLNL
ncbi:hypothetical protein B0J17DRAFT_667594 [Rhizoctonia solani]|nr:hypothetical protein B0J17DRAFT_667594 [Rhizoctonia solani]